MTAPDSPRRRLPGLALALGVLVGGTAALLGLFFFLLNDAWVPIQVPRAPPWSEGTASVGYEAHFAALVLIPLGLGAAAAA
ncbi:MAG TPA: hypothetical protein VM285_12535, partial [Polyangia bacterium]|nr:hypothetical protein [Polyangia bacterium]